MELWSWILCGIFSFFTVLGNGGVILLITASRRLHTTANWFVLSLAVADFFFGVVLLPVEKLRGVYPHCSLIKFILATASITNLCVMTFDRYIAIVHPLRYVTFMRSRRVGLLISAAWVMALIRPLFRSNKIKEGLFPSSVNYALKVLDKIVFRMTPCITLLLATIIILLIVRRQKTKSRKLEAQLRFNHSPGRQVTRSSKRTSPSSQTGESVSAKLTVVVVAVFLLTYGIKEVADRTKDETVQEVFYLFMIINSSVNPLAYAVFKMDIRREIRLLWRGLKK